MSWSKKRGQASPAPGPPVQMYNPNQHSTHQDNQWQQQQSHDNYYNQPQQSVQQAKPDPNYWQQPGYQNQQQQQAYPTPQTYGQYQEPQQQGYYQNNSGYPPQDYGNLQYNQQYNAQNNVYAPPAQTDTDGWGSTWGWGDEDNSNIQAPAQPSISESFVNDTAWNWTLDEANAAKPPNGKAESEADPVPKNPPIDRLTGKRGKLETPQWSVESQVSQESSDEVVQTSDSEKSRMLSRSSTVSHSPISGGQDAPQEVLENKEIVPQVNLLKPNPTPPLPANTVTPPLGPPSDQAGGNPYKRNTRMAHKVANRFGAPPPNAFHANEVNLETLPDNSEQPDSIPTATVRKLSTNALAPQWPDNNEAPINDRNQYLETGQLTDEAHGFSQLTPVEGTSVGEDALPPPGLRRMVLGQMEQQETNAGYAQEPPPGLSRMVPGQLESAPTPPSTHEPPEGLHRMIPGESSSPESSLRQSSYQTHEDVASEPELGNISQQQPRSATIGADTPPAVATTTNRSETIGADPSPTSQDSRTRGASNSSGENRRTVKKPQQRRRESIDGDEELHGLVNSVRNLTVDHSNKDDKGEKNEDGVVRRRSRESSESERDTRGKSPRERERRYKEEARDRNRGRYSPEDYRDKKYERRYKNRRYEEDTDYYSDKERDKRQREEYDKKYSSLKKDKERDRRRKDNRDYARDPRKNEYYYRRYEDTYENEPTSRTSSRSDSVHENYRDRRHDRDRGDRRNKEKDRHHHRRHRDVRDSRDLFNPYGQGGYGYDMYSQYYQQYHYYENLRKTNPQAYAELYKKYYAERSADTSYAGEERASVHSGRSSANDELAKDRYTRQSYYSQTSLPQGGYYRGGSQAHSISGQYGLDESSLLRGYDNTDNSINYEDSNLSTQRLTPAKFTTAHVKASISSGKLVKIFPNYPLDGEAPSVELYNLELFLGDDPEYQELKCFPGPLIKGTTHKKTIIEYCESKIIDAGFNVEINDPDSYVLMWELLILLIRQNGMVVGADIAELLLKNRKPEVRPRPPSVISSVGSHQGESGIDIHKASSETNLSTALKEEEVTNKFREYLLYGSVKEALEWAMKHGLWGHALFLASKLDKRTYANVLMRFANGLTMNDPLQTLYQLLSGKTPAAVTCVADEKWGDWRPHLAMILSNSTQRPELNCKAITVLGDTLIGRGNLYAAHFCYLMAEVGFSNHGTPDAKLVLLGANHNKAFLHFATNEAIHMTEIYEYACSLNDNDFSLVNFQRYKYLLATRLADVGLLERSLSYLEKISNFIVKNPTALEGNLINQVVCLSDRLKYYDPIVDGEDDDDTDFNVNLDTSRPDNSWLKDLKQVQSDCIMGLYQAPNNDPDSTLQLDQSQYVQGQDAWQQPPQWGTETQAEQPQVDYLQQDPQQEDVYAANQYQEQQYWPGQSQWEQPSVYQPDLSTPNQNYYGSMAQSEPEPVKKEPPEEIATQPQISLPNQQQEAGDSDQGRKEAPRAAPTKLSPEKPTGNGWFGGIFSKLSLKPKNQMKLPDDKNPSIVWDPEKKRWTNTDEDGPEGTIEFKPPPKMSDIMPKMSPPNSVPPQLQQQPFASAPTFVQPSQTTEPEAPGVPQPGQANMFKLQRGRNLKKSYIDVFNPNAKPGAQSAASAPASFPAPAQLNYFIPQPVNDPNAPMDFLTPAPPLQYEESGQTPQ